jgi:hypothetical protein
MAGTEFMCHPDGTCHCLGYICISSYTRSLWMLQLTAVMTSTITGSCWHLSMHVDVRAHISATSAVRKLRMTV